MSNDVQFVSEQVGLHMNDILRYFRTGAKITVLVRRPDVPDHSQDFVLTNDALEDAVTALQRRMDPDGTVHW